MGAEDSCLVYANIQGIVSSVAEEQGFCMLLVLVSSQCKVTANAIACAKPSYHICKLVTMCYVLSSKMATEVQELHQML